MTDVPVGPEDGDRVLMVGTVIVNAAPLLDPLATVTTTFPLVAPAGTGTTISELLQLVGVPAMPLNVTTLDP